MPTDHFPDFSGKHVQVYIKHRPDNSFLMQKVTFESQAGRLFLVGRISDALGDNCWAKGTPVCIAWDCVDQYILFDSAEDYRKHWDAWKLRNP